MELNEVLKNLDENQQKALVAVKSANELLELLKSYGFDGNLEEVKAYFKQFEKKTNTELSDDDLEDVNGGLDLGFIGRILFKNGIMGLFTDIFGDDNSKK